MSSASKARCASAGSGYEHIAATLGARPTTVLRTVTLPLVLPGLMSGAVLAFARSLGEFGATLTFAGSLQGVTRTLPLEIYLQRETDADAAVALSLAAHRRRRADRHRLGRAAAWRDRCERVRVQARLEQRGVEFDLALDDGEVLAVLGPNGVGKSTLLLLIAGPASARPGPDRARRTVVTDTSTGAFVPAHARGVAMLSQQAMLFPHMSAAANVALRPALQGPEPIGCPRHGPAVARRPSAPQTSPTGDLPSCREARRSASPSPARWPPNRECCCSTNRWPPST